MSCTANVSNDVVDDDDASANLHPRNHPAPRCFWRRWHATLENGLLTLVPHYTQGAAPVLPAKVCSEVYNPFLLVPFISLPLLPWNGSPELRLCL